MEGLGKSTDDGDGCFQFMRGIGNELFAHFKEAVVRCFILKNQDGPAIVFDRGCHKI